MTKFRLFLLLFRNMRLSSKRSLLRDSNRVGMILVSIGIGIGCIYLIVLGAMLGMASAEEGAGCIFMLMGPLLLCDFFIRLGLQQTPPMFLKPYLLMPVRRSDVIDCYLLSTFANPHNLVWLACFIPYSVISVCGGTSFFVAVAVLLVCQMLVFINGLWYLAVRTLTGVSIFWWALPAAVYCVIFVFGSAVGMQACLEMCMEYGFHPAGITVYAALLISLFVVDRWIIGRSAYLETARIDNIRMKRVMQFRFLNRYGLVGEYIKLELKSTMRNPVIRRVFLQSLILIVIISCLLAYTDMYDNSGDFWCLYCFSIIGTANLGRIMGQEGNYIDFLMVHEENILTLLKAKYYFYCAVSILPAVILIPTVISGKYHPLMIPAYFLTVSGTVYFVSFQFAVYNKQTLPLDRRTTGNGASGHTLQIVFSIVSLLLPLLLVILLLAVLDESTAYSVLIVVGALLTLTNSLWLRSIYRRMMKRRYDNIEGFHQTRSH